MPSPEPIDEQQRQHQRRSASRPARSPARASARIAIDEPDQRHALVVRDVHHQPAGDRRPHHRRAHQRDQRQAGLAGGEMQHHLEIQRHEDRHADQRAHVAGAGERRAAHHRIAEHGERQERLRASHQPPGEQQPQHQPTPASSPPICAEIQAKSPPAPRQRQQQRHRRRHHQHRADDVEAMLARMKRHAA